MKCEEVDYLMIDYLDGKVDDKVKNEIEKHLNNCERCLDELKDTKQLLGTVSKEVMVTPDESLKINFYHMLHNEIRKNEETKPVVRTISPSPWYNKSSYRIAAAVALLVAGTFIGMFIRNNPVQSVASNEMLQLRSEVNDLKKNVMLTMLKEESSSDRIQAVSYATEMEDVDENVIRVLVSTLNNDKNVNVKMAAAFALSKFASKKEVTDALVNSLEHQEDPILQVTLINILTERNIKSALVPVQKIIANKSTIKEVRDVAKNSLHVLI
jgi:hypothetical protein